MNAAVPNPWTRVFAPFAIGYFFSYLLRNANAVISPELRGDLGLTNADLGLLTSAYLLAFGAFQLPLGLLLDRFGPRRVEATLLLICAAGCALFAAGQGITQLTLGRAMIGLGVSACLMGSFKSFSLWFPLERQASLNAAIMAAGGLGAMFASSPLSLLLPLLGWRGIFFVLAGLTLGVSLLIFTSPEKSIHSGRETLARQLEGLATIFKSRSFWRFAPQTTLIVGGFMALQGLWALPFMTQVDGLSREAAARVLLMMAAAMMVGFLLIAFFVRRLTHAGLPPAHLLAIGIGCGLIMTLGIVLQLGPAWLLWPSLGLVFAVSNLAYALLTAEFPVELAGRANTALNFGSFIGAFGIQWLFGVAVDALQRAGLATPEAYRAALAVVLALQAAGWGWYVLETRRAQRGAVKLP
ncbi:MFS transporter [Sulfuricystis multivorans]|uniref:MFS transporter n=1 Tax=Sulfuricystis multivorans TaxID=2211108 RepID=UPI000F82CA95|nr:MFS transporter [Sulfuricystis multivorans]